MLFSDFLMCHRSLVMFMHSHFFQFHGSHPSSWKNKCEHFWGTRCKFTWNSTNSIRLELNWNSVNFPSGFPCGAVFLCLLCQSVCMRSCLRHCRRPRLTLIHSFSAATDTSFVCTRTCFFVWSFEVRKYEVTILLVFRFLLFTNPNSNIERKKEFGVVI